MDYAGRQCFLTLIGSGVVEAACKTLVTERLQRSVNALARGRRVAGLWAQSGRFEAVGVALAYFSLDRVNIMPSGGPAVAAGRGIGYPCPCYDGDLGGWRDGVVGGVPGSAGAVGQG